MALPSYGETFAPVLAYLYQKNSPVHISELKKTFREHFKPSEEDLMETTQTGHNRFDNRAHWAVVYFKQAELVDRPKRGYAQITEFGRDFFENNPTFSLKTLKEKTRYLENEASYKRNNEVIPETTEDENSDFEDSEQVVLSSDEYYESIEAELLLRLKNMGENNADKGTLFEDLCLKLLKEMGYGEYQRILRPFLGRLSPATVECGLSGSTLICTPARFLSARLFGTLVSSRL